MTFKLTEVEMVEMVQAAQYLLDADRFPEPETEAAANRIIAEQILAAIVEERVAEALKEAKP